MWSLGCIFYEMLTNQPLFAGDSEIDQLFKIFHILGTPTTTVWPELESLPDWNDKFPHFSGNFRNFWEKPNLILGTGIVSHDGFLITKGQTSLIDKMLAYDPDNRIQPCDALEDPYFRRYFWYKFWTILREILFSPFSYEAQSGFLYCSFHVI